MIRTFAGRDTERLFHRESVARFRAFQRVAQRRLYVLDQANDLRVIAQIPGCRLEKLRGDRRGQWSIRINKQWRVCFRFEAGDAYDVEIVDYH
jgi:proteic killer suppression protein